MKITVETVVKSDIDSTWAAWNSPEDINSWNAASDDWHTTKSSVDLRVGGKFCYRMEAKDGSMGFDFEGAYSNIIDNKLIEYTLGDDRHVSIDFKEVEDGVKVTETFEAEDENNTELQRQGWQSILNNFANHVESKAKR
ncbi:ATPase [Pseudomonas cavernicola]|uniref:ATPase n=1 Tax=Pseudomonas cavernicola TaxID=2320866 RepID=A0A418XF82_9PSED|nr:SRPBCC family protein [Pseudomonas cavernicola]RJG11003.1 ATPase [Pseudomonas cavernicola]